MQEQQQFPGLHNDSCEQICTALEHEWNTKILLPSGHYRATGEHIACCPFCFGKCHAEYVDVGVGMVQCEPFCCEDCGATEIGSVEGYGAPEGATVWMGYYLPVEGPSDTEQWQAVVTNSDHAYTCRCQGCRTWWISVGPDGFKDDGTLDFGPFTELEIRLSMGVQGDEYIAKQRAYATGASE